MTRLWPVAHLLSWIVILGVTAWVWIEDPRSRSLPEELAGIAVVRDLVYRPGASPPARLDIYLPSPPNGVLGRSSRRPAVLAIHGGSWTGGSRWEYGHQVARMAKYGHVVFVADYLLARPGHPSWPGAIEDLREAVRWIRRHSEEYHVDPDRLIALGSGSGGHLASLLGTSAFKPEAGETSSRVQAVVNLYGPTDLEETVRGRRLAHDPVWSFLGEDWRRAVCPPGSASPIHEAGGDAAPMLLVHGLDDTWVSPQQSEEMADLLSRLGVKHRLILVASARHGFEFRIGSPETRDLLPEILAFLESLWNETAAHPGRAA